MAEVKNAFIKSKMNKDLDARLLPSGEYRDAMNVSISKSEGADVGAVENIKGNELLFDIFEEESLLITATVDYCDTTDIYITTAPVGIKAGDEVYINDVLIGIVVEYLPGDFDVIIDRTAVGNPGDTVEFRPVVDIIGYYSDEATNNLYIFSTDQDVPVGTQVDPYANCFIHTYNFSDSSPITKKAEGAFLNFSKQNFISGVNLLEDLLFFTDNRNQPRVLNVSKPYTYYTNEDHVSVAKFAPFKPISLLEEHETTVTSASIAVGDITFTVAPPHDIKVGDYVVSGTKQVGRVKSFANPTVTLDRAFNANTIMANGDEVVFRRSTMINRTEEFLDSYNKSTGSIQNPNYDSTWQGDSDFLEDKFIRFSYRFKFDDNQYSLIAPFTQPIFIPKQFGYFQVDDETQTYKSSVVSFFENFIQEVGLRIPLPSNTEGDDNWGSNRFKIKEIDILYKESDSLALKVMSTIVSSNITSSSIVGEDNLYTFNYTSKKPYKTLPEKEIVRVYDRVPITAKTQEVISNRVVYGNYKDKNNPPTALPDYYVSALPKDFARFTTTAQYPSHSLKQNRTYQVGLILSDRYGRSTSVLLSRKDAQTDGAGSTVFNSYKNSIFFTDVDGVTYEGNPVEWWEGDALRFTLDSPIETNAQSDYPGLYASSNNGNKSWDLYNTGSSTPYVTSKTSTTYTINQNISSKVLEGDYLRGKYIDYTKVTDVTWSSPNTIITTEEEISDIYTETVSSSVIREAYEINTLGWYSYKIVVKQNEQEYYNVYLPLVINGGYLLNTGTPSTSDDQDELAQSVLINDNINKVPRNLSEVGPDQKQYSSDVKLFGRVAPERATGATNNIQWYPSIASDQVSKIATAIDSGYDVDYPQSPSAATGFYFGMYNQNTNPSILTISSLAPSGSTETLGRLPNSTTSITQNLSVYETNPTISLLDIFWETSATGLLSDLNLDALNQFDGAIGVDNTTYSFSLSEDDAASVLSPFNCTTTPWYFVNSEGPITVGIGTVTAELVSVKDANGDNVPFHGFYLVDNLDNTFNLFTSKNFTYIQDSSEKFDFTFTYNVTLDKGGGDVYESVITSTGFLQNITPTIQDPGALNIEDADTDIYDFLSAAGTSNGSAITSEQKQQLVFTKVKEIWSYDGSNTNVFSVNSTTGVLTKNVEGLEGEEYTIQVKVEDANLGVGSLSATTPDIEIQIGDDSLNIKPCPNPWGGLVTTSSSPNRTFVQYFGANTSGEGDPAEYTNNLPSGTYSLVTGIHRNNVDGTEQGHQKGQMRFKLQLFADCENPFGTFTGLSTDYWIQYKEVGAPSSTWQTYAGGNGSGSISVISDSSSTSVYIPSATTAIDPQAGTAQDPYYEWRVIINQIDSDRTCSPNDPDSGTGFDRIELDVVDVGGFTYTCP